MKHWIRILLVGALAIGLAAESHAAAKLTSPAAVSPGDAVRVAPVKSACPTFSWGLAPGATGYELVVYELAADLLAASSVGTVQPSAEQSRAPLIRTVLPAMATTWTPSADLCLERGGSYAWFARAVGNKRARASAWSEARLFRVAAAPSAEEVEQALETLRAYVGQAAPAEAGNMVEIGASAGRARIESLVPSPLASPAENEPTPPSVSGLVVDLLNPSGRTFSVHGVTNTVDTPAVGDTPSGGVVGEARATSGEAAGVVGFSAAEDGAGVYGASPNYGVEGIAPYVGVYGHADGLGPFTESAGVRGEGGLDNYGVFGRSGWIGVGGVGDWNGVYGAAVAPNGHGVWGDAYNEARCGVYGSSHATSAVPYAAGICGYSGGGGAPAGRFDGEVVVDGDLTQENGAVDLTGATSMALPASGIAGAGHDSGLDADQLDGKHASELATANHTHSTTKVRRNNSRDIPASNTASAACGSHQSLTGGSCRCPAGTTIDHSQMSVDERGWECVCSGNGLVEATAICL